MNTESLDNHSGEEWRPVVGAEGKYSISNLGRVRTEARTIVRRNGWPYPVRERILAQATDAKMGYKGVSLSYELKAPKWRPVHRLVLESFIGPRPEGLEVCHNNGIPSDNRLENLRYATHNENMIDIVRHGYHNNAIKTQCPSGHPYSDENTLIVICRDRTQRAERHCRKCMTERQRAYRTRLEAAKRAA